MYSTLINAPEGGNQAFYAARYARLGEIFHPKKSSNRTGTRLKDLGDLIFYRPPQGGLDVTALVCGDPQPGRSALDKKREEDNFLQNEAAYSFVF